MAEPETPPIAGKGGAFWKKQIELSLAVRRHVEPWWEFELKRYSPLADGGTPEHYAERINTNRPFTLVERKGADMFYQRPDVSFQPTPLQDLPIAGTAQPDPTTGQMGPGIPQTVGLQAHQDITNEKLGPDGVDAVKLARRTIFDVLCHQGVGFTVMGFESFTVPVEQMDPMTGEPTTVPVPVSERCFWEHVVGKRAIVPHNFRSTDWDRAPYLGHQFELPLTPGNRQKYQLPEEFTGGKPDDRLHYDHGGPKEDASTPVFTGVELWYRSMLFREDIQHPEHLTHLVLVDGIDEPVIEEDCPYQTLDESGQLTPDSLIGFPIHPLNTRTVPDSAWPPSDCVVIRPLVNELDRFREQMVEARDAMILRWAYNMDVLPPEAVQKIARSPISGMIGLPADAFVGEGAIKEMPHGSFPRESFTMNDYVDNDIARTTAIDASGAGVQSAGSSTATEQQIIQANANARLDFERGVVLQWYLKGVTKFSTLLQRYLSVEHAAQIVGPERAQVWDVWRKQVPSALAFTAMPDSALRVDQAVDRKTTQDLYSFLANDPYMANGRAKLLEKLLRKHHIDPTGLVAPPQPPKPEPPKLALSFKGEDLVGPQAPIVIEILQQQGIQISPQAVTQSQGLLLQAQELAAAQDAQAEGDPTHGGKLPQQESLSKHAADQTGGMQNTGAPAAMGAAGGMLQ